MSYIFGQAELPESDAKIKSRKNNWSQVETKFDSRRAYVQSRVFNYKLMINKGKRKTDNMLATLQENI